MSNPDLEINYNLSMVSPLTHGLVKNHPIPHVLSHIDHCHP